MFDLRRVGTTAIVAAALLAGCDRDATGPEDDLPTELTTLVGDSLFGTVPGLVGGPMTVTAIGLPPGCQHSRGTGRTECPTIRDPRGLTVTRSVAFYDARGNQQEAFDPATTDRINTRIEAEWSLTNATTEITSHRTGDYTLSGLTRADGRITHNGVGAGTEVHVVTGRRGTVRMERWLADTVRDVVIDRRPGAPRWPLGGTEIHVMQSAQTDLGPSSEARVFDHRMTITYDGTSVVRMTFTANGRTTTCTRDLARREPPRCR